MTAKKIAIILAAVATVFFAGAIVFMIFRSPVFQAPKDVPAVSFPQANSEVENVFTVTGKAPGNWFFEAMFPITIEDPTGNEIASNYVQAEGEWMTADLIPFSGTIAAPGGFSGQANLVLKKDNPSGLPENDARISIPINIKAFQGASEVTVYFGKYGPDSSMQACAEVFAVKRNIQNTRAVAKAAITELLKGPSESEKEEGYFTSINNGVTLNGIIIDKGIIRADFNEALGRAVGGSCRVTHIRAQIMKTLEQFPTVRSVVISVNGRTEDILQP